MKAKWIKRIPHLTSKPPFAGIIHIAAFVCAGNENGEVTLSWTALPNDETDPKLILEIERLSYLSKQLVRKNSRG